MKREQTLLDRLASGTVNERDGYRIEVVRDGGEYQEQDLCFCNPQDRWVWLTADGEVYETRWRNEFTRPMDELTQSEIALARELVEELRLELVW